MEERKRKRSGSTSQKEETQPLQPRAPKRIKRSKPASDIKFFDVLPDEIVENILLRVIASSFIPDKKEDGVMNIVCRMTCRRWRDIIDPFKVKCFKFIQCVVHSGNMSLLKWGVQNGAPFPEEREALFCKIAASRGHLVVLKWLIDDYACEDNRLKLFKVAARGGHVEVLEWLNEVEEAKQEERKKNNKEPEATTLELFSGEIFLMAASGGSLRVLKWLNEKAGLKEIEFENLFEITEAAAKGGHLEALKWLKENGCPLGITTAYAAAKGGYLEALKWLKENECPWDASIFCAAAQLGNFEMLEWLKANGCPWNEYTYLAASAHKEVRRWLQENGCPSFIGRSAQMMERMQGKQQQLSSSESLL